MTRSEFLFCLSASFAHSKGPAAKGGNSGYRWHDSSQYSRVIVNATQGIERVPKEWLGRDRLVTDFEITNVNAVGRTEARKQYRAIRARLESYGLSVGTYLSGTSVAPEMEQGFWPLRMVPLERMPPWARYSGTWPGSPNRRIIDVTDNRTRHYFQKEIGRLWREVTAPVRFVDNAAAHTNAGGNGNWAACCRNMKEIREIGAHFGSVHVFNIAVHIGGLSDQETRELMEAVASEGICLEMPWPSSIRKTLAATEQARARYRELLDSGMAIIMIPIDGDPHELARWVRTWRKPSDAIYISGAFYHAPDMTLFGPGLSSSSGQPGKSIL